MSFGENRFFQANKNKSKSVELVAICCTDPDSSYGKQDDLKAIGKLDPTGAA